MHDNTRECEHRSRPIREHVSIMRAAARTSFGRHIHTNGDIERARIATNKLCECKRRSLPISKHTVFVRAAARTFVEYHTRWTRLNMYRPATVW